jgi:hypothetical protein
MSARTRLLALCSTAILTACFTGACATPTDEDGDDQSSNIGAGAALPDNYAYAWNGGEALPEKDAWSAMYRHGAEIADGFNAGTGKFVFKPKEIGGSSLYAYVDEGASRHGLWLPPSASTWTLEEIFAFNLSRLFGHGDWAAPASRLTLNKTASAAYKQMLEGMRVSGIQACNKDHQLKYMDQNPNYFIGVYKEFVPGTKVGDVKSLVKDDTLNADHAVAKYLSQSATMPTREPVYLVKSGGTYEIIVKGAPTYAAAQQNFVAQSTELEVATQLNHMMFVDVLNNQRDRYGSGTNMNIFIDKEQKTFRLALIDNGGGSATIPTKYVNDFKRKVTRFDPTLAKDVLDLDTFVNGGAAAPYKGFTSEDALKHALGYEDIDTNEFGTYSSDCGSWSYPSVGSYKSRWDRKWRNFKTALGLLATHIKANNARLE